MAFLQVLLLAAIGGAVAFYNPIVPEGQDPSAKFFNGKYYLVQTIGDGGIQVIRAQRLENLGIGIKTTVWTAPSDTAYCCEVWSPELVYWEDEARWYIYFAADDGNSDNHRTYVLQGEQNAAPDGTYTFIGKIAAATDNWAIDSSVIQINGTRYLIWSGWPGDVDGFQDLYIAQMSSPTTLSTDRHVLSTPTSAWETDPNGVGVNEGPAPLEKDGRSYIAFSASGSWDDTYCLGLLTYLGGDPLVQGNWKKSDGCVFQSNPDSSVYAPGHNSFTVSPDGTETWNVYHANVKAGAGWNGRSIRAQQVVWNKDGSPVLGVPVGFNDNLDPPSGE